jgi:hypothetical protein
VPNYDFNWQTTYELKTPKLLPDAPAPKAATVSQATN